MRISDWSSDVCSSDLLDLPCAQQVEIAWQTLDAVTVDAAQIGLDQAARPGERFLRADAGLLEDAGYECLQRFGRNECGGRSEEHTSELQSLMRISYAVFCLQKKKKTNDSDKHVTSSVHKRTIQT